MIKILKRGTRKKITCEHCDSLLAYTAEDVHHSTITYIVCPVCNARIIFTSLPFKI